ncbi:hypothetical protein NYZ99_14630 [Maribacter litopenaei]|uniref:Uncharacterized protein n=1 Tax=Maribacter litopenaei TaxID=2976127 RepID=A0ABY5Y5C8_9FLAO|nr:hypothetical protein [Maribacter litopenaei]UWX54203.1 hypothetical protein NYZ99_14630 [Maribacter litopenaei]
MKTILFFALTFLFFLNTNAQEITVFPGFWSMEYYQDDDRITKKELKALLAKNEEINAYWKKSNTYSTLGYLSLLGEGVGAFWLASTLNTDNPNETLAPLGVTLGFATIGLIFIHSANENGKKAILAYNKQFDNESTFKLVPTSNSNGVGLGLEILKLLKFKVLILG